MESLAAVRMKDAPASLAASGRFRNFRPENEQNTRASKVESDPVLEEMTRLFKMVYAWGSVDLNYCETAVRIRGLEYGSKDVENLSLALAELPYEESFSIRAGLFLSVLMNDSKEDDFVIHTAHMHLPPNFLGIFNTKVVSVDGPVGNGLGYKMRGGSITVRGDAMGEICELMSGGEVRIDGGYGGIDTRFIRSGTIYSKGELVFPK
jgi:hypothetical protein